MSPYKNKPLKRAFEKYKPQGLFSEFYSNMAYKIALNLSTSMKNVSYHDMPQEFYGTCMGWNCTVLMTVTICFDNNSIKGQFCLGVRLQQFVINPYKWP